ncbi:MAG: thermonuclease family protein [Bauldia sp.]|uniref:thermonuclease family protein n=1 Tax=Bauldia sp. TaxID=2575872 RepID=UPI001DCCB133|nr:thermonuclease family protein [Bauldia sp.]MCB1494688.1 thermonuclease family protein [Bauldia sp.]
MDGAHRLGEPVTLRLGAAADSGAKAGRRSGGPLALLLILANAILAAGCGGLSAEELEVVPPPARNVTPPGILPGPQVDGPLYREPTPPPPPAPPRWRRFFLPKTTDGATFVTRNHLVIKVFGVTPPPLDQICRRMDGEEWPCGRTALFSLRMFLRGRAVECLLPNPDGIDRAVAPCRVGSIDVGRWLLRQGWATPDENATDEYRTAAHDARCDRVGMWRGSEADPGCPGKPADDPPPS